MNFLCQLDNYKHDWCEVEASNMHAAAVQLIRHAPSIVIARLKAGESITVWVAHNLPANLHPNGNPIAVTQLSVTPEDADEREMERWTPLQQVMCTTLPADCDAMWENDTYVVLVRRMHGNESFPDLVHLSIRRHDRSVIAHDWRDMQRIKNEIVGPECEGVEMFPAESRMVDTSNQFHLWVIDDPTFRFPFGYDGRLVVEEEAANTRQRPWHKENRPNDITLLDELGDLS